MDKFRTDIEGEGMPIFLDDLRFVQNTQNFAFEAIMKSLYPSIILYGCVGTDNGNSTMTISAGALTIDGEICRVDEHIIDYNPPTRYNFEITEDADNDGNKMFGDGVARDTYFWRRAKLVEQTLSNEYNPSSNSRNLLTRLSNQALPFSRNEIVLTNLSKQFVTEARETAFNKEFGMSAGKIVEIDSALAPYQVVRTSGSNKLVSYPIKTAFNKSFGTIQGTVSEGHSHPYELIIDRKTAFNKHFSNKTETLAGTSETTVVSPKR